MNDKQPEYTLNLSLAQTEGLQEIEALIRDRLTSDAASLTEIASYLVALGGKRIRPLIALLSAKALGMKAPSRQLLEVAAGIELIHSATLLHDDIIDKSPVRRKEASAYVKFGLPGTLLAGDFLLVRAFGLCAHLDSRLVEATENACVELTEGEILEIPLFMRSFTLNDGLEIARQKTASLFRLAAECAAHLAGVEEEICAHMRSFGENLGIAFQILDDILDVAGTEEVLGKATGIDIRERKPSIVNLLWLKAGDELGRRLLHAPEEDEEDFIREALEALKTGSVVEEATGMAHQYAGKAAESLRKALSADADSTDREAAEQLFAIVSFVVSRLN